MKKKISLILVLALMVVSICPEMTVQAAKKVKPKLNKTKVTLKVGKSVKLKLKKAKGKVTWSVKNKKIATVTKSGKVKAKKAGRTYVYAKNKGKKYRCRIIVKKKVVIEDDEEDDYEEEDIVSDPTATPKTDKDKDDEAEPTNKPTATPENGGTSVTVTPVPTATPVPLQASAAEGYITCMSEKEIFHLESDVDYLYDEGVITSNDSSKYKGICIFTNQKDGTHSNHNDYNFYYCRPQTLGRGLEYSVWDPDTVEYYTQCFENSFYKDNDEDIAFTMNNCFSNIPNSIFNFHVMRTDGLGYTSNNYITGDNNFCSTIVDACGRFWINGNNNFNNSRFINSESIGDIVGDNNFSNSNTVGAGVSGSIIGNDNYTNCDDLEQVFIDGDLIGNNNFTDCGKLRQIMVYGDYKATKAPLNLSVINLCNIYAGNIIGDEAFRGINTPIMFHTLNKPKEDMLIQGDYMFADSGENFIGIGTTQSLSNDVVITLDGEHMFKGVIPTRYNDTCTMINSGSDIIVKDPYLAEDCPDMIFALETSDYEDTAIYKYCKENNMTLLAGGGSAVCGRELDEIYPDWEWIEG